jgi:hypothetical protein
VQTLTEEEIDAFSEQRWLLDQNIEFWLEHVVYDLRKSNGVSFLSPSAVQMAHLFGPGRRCPSQLARFPWPLVLPPVTST